MKNRIIAVFMVALLISCTCVPFVSAVDTDISGSGGVTFALTNPNSETGPHSTVSIDYPRSGVNNSIVTNLAWDSTVKPSYGWTDDTAVFYVDEVSYGLNTGYLTGAIGVYFSYFIVHPSYAGAYPQMGSPSFSLSYENQLGQTGSGTSSEVSTFEPAFDAVGYSCSKGFSVKDGTFAESENPVTNLVLNFEGDPGLKGYRPDVGYCTAQLYVPSMSLVVTETSEELEALEGIADSLASQSEILSAMYGDIMEVLNAIYSRTGDILSTQQIANNYLSALGLKLDTINSSVNSLHTTTQNIYSLLSVQLTALIQAINTASTDIQGAIAQQTQDIIDYLNSVYGSAVGDLPGKTDDLQGQIDSNTAIEKDYQDNAQTQFEDLFTDYGDGLTGDVLNSMFYVVSIFEGVWSGFGDYVIVYTFPLFLGLCLLIVGRLSRYGGGSTSRSKEDSDDA